MASVLIISPRYDATTRTTSSWSEELFALLKADGHAPALYLSSSATLESLLTAAPSCDLVVFYGHGDNERLIGQPTGNIVRGGPTLVGVQNAHVLVGKPVYATACHALAGLGGEYASLFPSGCFVGYDGEFCFAVRSQSHFGRVVNQNALMMAETLDGNLVVQELSKQWVDLSDEFMFGPLNTEMDSFVAALAASRNAERVGMKP